MYYNKLKIIRKEKGITLEKLSELCGVSAGYLCHLEKRFKSSSFNRGNGKNSKSFK